MNLFAGTLLAACAGMPGPVQSLPDATMVFMSNRDGNAEIYSLSAESPEWTNLTNTPFSENWPEWSPDGRWIAYQSNQHGRLDVWVMAADGSQARRLTDNDAHDYLPAWSPDGSQMTFLSRRQEPWDVEEAPHVYIMNADGSGQRRLFADSPHTSTAAKWLPDGSGFLLTRRTGDDGGDLYIVDADGNIVRQLTDDAAYNGGAEISPDGRQVAFYSAHGDESEIHIINLDGTGRRTIVSGGQYWYPRWSPDGHFLLLTVRRAGADENDLDLYVVEIASGAVPVRVIGGPGREAEGRWRPAQ